MALEVKFFQPLGPDAKAPDPTYEGAPLVARKLEISSLIPFIEQQFKCKVIGDQLHVQVLQYCQDYDLIDLAEKGELLGIVGKAVKAKDPEVYDGSPTGS